MSSKKQNLEMAFWSHVSGGGQAARPKQNAAPQATNNEPPMDFDDDIPF